MMTESITTPVIRDIIDARDLPIGKAIRQGDIYLQRTEHRNWNPLQRRRGGAVQPGLEIARHHVLYGRKEVRGYGWDPTRAIRLLSEGRLCHPEHADFLLAPGDYLVAVQIEPRTRRRVID